MATGRIALIALIASVAPSPLPAYGSPATRAVPRQRSTPSCGPLLPGTRCRPPIGGERPPVYPLGTVQFGASTDGAPLTVVHRQGSPAPTRRILVVGQIHADEPQGIRVATALLSAKLPADLDLWIVRVANPDGLASRRHGNARDVDLNRNFEVGWQTGTPQSTGKYFSGRAPGSEPETQALMRLLDWITPDTTIWYHQPWKTVDCNVERVGDVCRRYAAAIGRSAGGGVTFAPRPGTATDFQMSSGLGAAFVVELAAGTVPANVIAAHARAVIGLQPD